MGVRSSFKGFYLVSSTLIDGFYPTGQGSNVRVVSSPNYVCSNYASGIYDGPTVSQSLINSLFVTGSSEPTVIERP